MSKSKRAPVSDSSVKPRECEHCKHCAYGAACPDAKANGCPGETMHEFEFTVEGCVFRGSREDEERIRAAAREHGGWVPSEATVGVLQRGVYRDGEEFWYRNGEEYR